MSIIKSIMENINSIKLTNHQAYALLLIYSTPTPELALEYINGSEKLISSTAYLKRMQLINFRPSGYTTNNSGEAVLKFNGFIDEEGNLTKNGKNFLDSKSSDIR